jgi:hypothetical protein
VVVKNYITVLSLLIRVATHKPQLILFLRVVVVRARMRVMVPLGVAVFMVAEVRLMLLVLLGQFPVVEVGVELLLPIEVMVAQEM